MASLLKGGPSDGGELVQLRPSLDTNTPRVARIYNVLLGDDRDSFASEREAAAKILALNPRIAHMVKANRRFLGRAVEYAVGEAGMRQILDIGSGYPTQRNVHEVAEEVAPGKVRTVYVDNDEVVAIHGAALLDSQTKKHSRSWFIKGDLRSPAEILWASMPHIDYTRPVALLLVAVLHFIPDDEDPHGIVADLVGTLAPGSLLILSHVLRDPSMTEAARVYEGASAPGVPRSREEVAAFFRGLHMVEPGLVAMPGWRPDNPFDQHEAEHRPMPVLCGVGVKR
ncbi:SAM-dependent methyltransferase [Sphaerisporangium sp. NPDC051011]|uniref:SAM-dependent methyltransferase n=1 Tax=Sphaerisporangium sp. NPDC051011 TaxID=3155792 RepID=UPI0033CD5C26